MNRHLSGTLKGKKLILLLLLFSLVCLLLVNEVYGVDEENNTFGYEAAGGSSHLWSGGDDLVGCMFTVPDLGAGTTVTAENITVCLQESVSGDVTFSCFIYQSNLSYVEKTEERTLNVPTTTWYTFSFSTNPTLIKGADYLLCIWGSDEYRTYYAGGSTNQTYRDTESYNYASPPDPFSEDQGWNEKQSIYCTFSQTYRYTFYGLYDETTGDRAGAVNVTAHYSGEGEATDTFEVDGSCWYWTNSLPLYFHFNLDTGDREYWPSSGETSATIYIFDNTLTEYTITFIDFTGVLDDYSFVSFKRIINGTLHTVEKRQADINARVVVNLISGTMYNIVISDSITYDYGQEYFGADTTVEILLRGLEFPQEIILAYRHVRMYATRRNNYSTIDLLYHDLDDETDHVDCRIKYANGTVANQTTLYTNMFNYTWASAQYNITYYVEMDAFHDTYGELNHRQVMYRGGFGISPWKLDWLGTIPDMEATALIPMGLIFAAALAFSKVNAYMGAFLATSLAILFTWWGWVNIAASMLIMALVFTILMALGYKKKRMIGL